MALSYVGNQAKSTLGQLLICGCPEPAAYPSEDIPGRQVAAVMPWLVSLISNRGMKD